jgi:PKD repeat protein
MSGSPARKVIAFSALIAIIAILVPFGVSCSKPPRPIAAFAVSYVSGELLIEEDPIAGTTPLTVRFTSQSTGEITSWRWNFGDGPAVQGGEELREVTHTYETPNSSGYIVLLTVRGPGGENQKVEESLVAVYSCSEAANVELNQARQAIEGCLTAAGKNVLDSNVPEWDGGPGKVIAGGIDAADYLGVWKTFKAVYTVDEYGDILYGTDVLWGCVFWDSSKVPQARWVAKT